MWKLKPLSGKYYGTVVENSITGEQITFWLSFMDYTEDEVSPREITDGWSQDCGFGHIESKRSLDAAVTFINAMNIKEVL